MIPPEILTENESYPTVGGQGGFIKMLTAASAKKQTPVCDCWPKGSGDLLQSFTDCTVYSKHLKAFMQTEDGWKEMRGRDVTE